MSLLRASGFAVIAGSSLFLVVAFLPISRVYGIQDARERLAVIAVLQECDAPLRRCLLCQRS